MIAVRRLERGCDAANGKVDLGDADAVAGALSARHCRA